MRVCQVKGCFSAKAPIYQPIMNIVTKDSTAVIGTGQLSSIVCEDCRNSIKLKDIFDKNNWADFVLAISKDMIPLNSPSYDNSFLTFSKIPQYTLH